MQPIKLFFDECCSPLLSRRIPEIFSEDYPQIEVRHLTEFFKAGTEDAKWIAILESKDWVVITADRGAEAKTPKLPLICSKLGVTHISMTPTLKHAGYSEHKQAMLTLWPQIVRARLLPKGIKVSMGYHMVNKGFSKIPWLSIDQQAFDVWCQANSVPQAPPPSKPQSQPQARTQSTLPLDPEKPN